MNYFFRPLLEALLLIILWQTFSQAQEVRKFSIPANPIELSRLVKRQIYFDAAGRRAAILGNEDGRFEAWVYPMKLFHDFRLTVSVEGGDADIDLTNYAQRVIARPESFTLVYSHPQFTIREILFSPIDEKGSIILFDVDSAKPLTLMANFIPDLKPMWPGGLGGQYAAWSAEQKFFIISESRRKFNGLVGSPMAVNGSSTPAHMLASGSVHFEIKIDPQKARNEFIPIVITGNTHGRAACIEQYNKLLANIESLYGQTVANYRKVREEKTGVITPDHHYNLSFEWAKVASEIWSGDYFRPLDTSVTHQLFSSGMIISPFIRGLLGLRAEALKKQLTIAPQLPAAWDALDVKRYRIGDESLSLSIRNAQGSYKAVIEKSGDTSYDLRFAPAFGYFTKVQAVTVDGKPIEFNLAETAQDVSVVVNARLTRHLEIEIKYTAGIEIDVPVAETELGQRTVGLKFLGVERNKDALNLLVEGLSGRAYKIRIRSSLRDIKLSGARWLSTSDEWRELEIAFEDTKPGGYLKKTVSLTMMKR